MTLFLRYAALLMWYHQGFCFVPLLFTLYTTLLIYVLSKFTTWIITLMQMTNKSTSDTWRSLYRLRDCLQDVSLWTKNSKLKKNADKTEFLIIGTPTQSRDMF